MSGELRCPMTALILSYTAHLYNRHKTPDLQSLRIKNKLNKYSKKPPRDLNKRAYQDKEIGELARFIKFCGYLTKYHRSKEIFFPPFCLYSKQLQ